MMIGDRILIYDTETGRYFAGFDRHGFRAYAKDAPISNWTSELSQAHFINNLAYAHRAVKLLGGSAKIISETRAQQIDSVKAYRRDGHV